jgi:predicted aspartyl protease
MNRLWVLGFGLLASMIAACDASPPRPLAPASENRTSDIPIQIENNLVLIDARVNGVQATAPFILDTGAEASVIDQADLAALGLRASGSIAADTGGGNVEAVSVKGAVFTVGGSTVPPADVLAIDLAGLESGLGHRIAGILGYEIFEQHAVEIDYASRVVRLHGPGSYRPSSKAQSLPITLTNRIPLIRVAFPTGAGSNAEGMLEFDTGQAGSVTVMKAFADTHTLISRSQPILPITAGGILAGKVSAFVTRLDRVRLGSIDFEKVVANLTPTTDDAGIGGETVGLLGGEVLRRFKVIVDYTRSQVTLEPNQSFAEPFEFDMSGMSLAAQGADLREYRVRSVVGGTPAERAGIAAGDIVVSIDDRPARDMTLTEVRRLLKQPDRVVVLELKRSVQLIRVRMQTHRLV